MEGNSIRLFGVAGKAQVGKDTVARMINRQTNYKFQVRRFADKLKDMTCLLLDCSREDLENIEFKNKSLGICYDMLTPRKVMQLMGTDFARKMIADDIWVNSLMMEFKPNESMWVIPDCRFPNEIQATRDRGGIVIRIDRDTQSKSYHSSERALDALNDSSFDYIIDNNGTLGELEEKVKLILIEQGIIR